MSGPEHYTEAERVMQESNWDDLAIVTRAQVHATLALTAATAYLAVRDHALGRSNPDSRAWTAATR